MSLFVDDDVDSGSMCNILVGPDTHEGVRIRKKLELKGLMSMNTSQPRLAAKASTEATLED